MAAGRGVFALLVGDKKAGAYFDFSRRGLYGSFVALALVIALNAALPVMLSSDHDPILVSVIQLVIAYVAQVGLIAVALRQTKRFDALVPFVIGYNWLNFFVALIVGAFLAAGVGGGGVLLVVAVIAALVVEVNLGRIVMTLAPLQIAAFLVAQIVGICIAAVILLLIFPPSPDALAQLTGS